MDVSRDAALRLAAAATFAIASLGAAAFLIGHIEQIPGDTATFTITIQGPEGIIWNGTVPVANATALSILQAAAATAGFDITLENYAGFGACGQYVSGIAGHHATATAGWIFEVRDPGGDWQWADRSADCYPLLETQALQWRWSEQA